MRVALFYATQSLRCPMLHMTSPDIGVSVATRTQTIRVSDLSGEDIGDAGQTVNFSIGSSNYVIDLSDKEAEKFFDAFKKYTDVAQKTGGRGVRSTGGSGRAKADKEQLAAMRSWARANGHQVSDRGRISQEIQDAYHAANK